MYIVSVPELMIDAVNLAPLGLGMNQLHVGFVTIMENGTVEE